MNSALEAERIGERIRVQRLAQAGSAEVEVTIEIEATAGEGFNEAVQSDVTENAATLKFDTSDFDS